MANILIVKAGSYSDPTIFSTGAPPTPADDVWLNGFNVTADTSINVLSLRNGSATGIAAGGSLTPVNGVTITAPSIIAGAGSTSLIGSTLPSGQSCSVIASSISVSAGGSAVAIQHSGGGSVSTTGVASGGSTAGGQAAIRNIGTGTLSHSGQVRGGGGSATAYGIENASTGTIIVTGDCFSGTASAAISNFSTGTANIVGTLTPANGLPCFISSNASAVNILSGPFLVSANGTGAVYALRWFWQNTAPAPTYYEIRSANLAIVRPLYTADSVGGNPATSNVRSGIIYGPNSELTGTCAVPPAASVGVGVPVDNTVGTAAVTASSIRAALGMAGANLDTQLARLANAATTSEVAQIVQGAMAPPP